MKKFNRNENYPVPLYRSVYQTKITLDCRKQEDSNPETKGTKKDKFVIWLDQPRTLPRNMTEFTEEWSMCEYHNLPYWLKNNNYLICGHRPPIPSVSVCLKSIFSLHTETINIWTHLIGCIMFIILEFIFFSKQTNLEERLVFTPFFIGVTVCLGFSTMFHTLNCYSENVAKWTNQLDYCGIALLIIGSLTPWIYCKFQCHPRLRVFYLSTISTLGICTVGISLLSKFGEPSYRFVRVIVFTMFALSGFVPVIHIQFIENWNMTIGVGTPYFIIASILYILGAIFYTLRIPEKLNPGTFDIWFHSHQIFHVLVVAAALLDYHGLTGVYKETINVKCP